MTTTEATNVREKYDSYDRNFRASKARKDFRKASEWKAKRDSLEAELKIAIAILQNSDKF